MVLTFTRSKSFACSGLPNFQIAKSVGASSLVSLFLDYHGRIKSHSRVTNGRTYAMTVNEFDQLDRPLRTDYDYPGSGQDEGILHRYDRHFENGLLIMGTATLINSLSHNHRGQLTRLNRPGDVKPALSLPK
jgi:hypothetical protein